MRKALLHVAIALLSGVAASASAETLTTSTRTTEILGVFPISTLAAFDSTLGILTNISLQIDGLDQTAYMVTAFNPPLATVNFSFDGTFPVRVNGAAYSFGISGSQTVIVNGYASPVLSASGTGLFEIDPSLFSTFIDTSNQCLPGQFGVCVSSWGAPVLAPDNPPPNTHWTGTDTYSSATYTLTYAYTPDVPEVATWGMMLLGFGAIGFAMRGQKKVKGEPLPSWPRHEYRNHGS